MIFSIDICPQSGVSLSTKQMLMGVENVSTYQTVTHYIDVPEVTHPNNPSIYSVWNYNANTQQYYIDNTLASSSITTTGPADYTESNWPGFNWDWLYGDYPDEAPWGLGFYKVTNDYNSNFFYIDTRDAEFNTGTPDFYAVINSEGEYEWQKPQGPYHGTEISNGEVVRSWDILNNTPNTAPLTSYWQNVLIGLVSNSSPRIVWGPYPGNVDGYKIYRAITTDGSIPTNFQLIATVSSSTYEYIDYNVATGNGRNGAYQVKAYYGSNIYGASNDVFYELGRGWAKRHDNLESSKTFQYSLDQNYPNPFNPLTRIRYSLAEKTNVRISVFNMMGQEVASLVNEVKEAGEYSVTFDASDLPSGVYIYSIRTDKYSKNRKMILMK